MCVCVCVCVCVCECVGLCVCERVCTSKAWHKYFEDAGTNIPEPSKDQNEVTRHIISIFFCMLIHTNSPVDGRVCVCVCVCVMEHTRDHLPRVYKMVCINR